MVPFDRRNVEIWGGLARFVNTLCSDDLPTSRDPSLANLKAPFGAADMFKFSQCLAGRASAPWIFGVLRITSRTLVPSQCATRPSIPRDQSVQTSPQKRRRNPVQGWALTHTKFNSD